MPPQTSLPIGEDTELSVRMRKLGKMRIDPDLYVLNSVRRMHKEGYLGMFVKYIRAFSKMARGKKIDVQHFKVFD